MDGTARDPAHLTASINPTAADFKRVYAWLFWHAPQRYFVAVLAVTLWLVAGNAWVHGNYFTAASEGALVAFYLLLALVQWAIVLPGRAWKATSDRFPLLVDFTAEGLILTGPGSLAKSAWQSFDRFIDVREFILLVHPDKTFFVVPKRDVDGGRLEDLEQLLAERLPRKTSMPS